MRKFQKKYITGRHFTVKDFQVKKFCEIVEFGRTLNISLKKGSFVIRLLAHVSLMLGKMKILRMTK